MEVQVLHIEGCPSSQAVARRLRAAMDAVGLQDAPITLRQLGSLAEIEGSQFAGSPTIVVDGRDLFPTDGKTTALACRVYPTPTGLAGSPTRAQLEDALRSHG